MFDDADVSVVFVFIFPLRTAGVDRFRLQS